MTSTTTHRPPSVGRVLARMANIGPGDVVLDPFVGGGALLVGARKRGAHVLGCDIAPPAIRQATAMYPGRVVARLCRKGSPAAARDSCGRVPGSGPRQKEVLSTRGTRRPSASRSHSPYEPTGRPSGSRATISDVPFPISTTYTVPSDPTAIVRAVDPVGTRYGQPATPLPSGANA